jgi:hypothetical protein
MQFIIVYSSKSLALSALQAEHAKTLAARGFQQHIKKL